MDASIGSQNWRLQNFLQRQMASRRGKRVERDGRVVPLAEGSIRRPTPGRSGPSTGGTPASIAIAYRRRPSLYLPPCFRYPDVLLCPQPSKTGGHVNLSQWIPLRVQFRSTSVASRRRSRPLVSTLPS